MNTVFLLLGTNLGNKTRNLQSAQKLIEQKIGAITKRSSIYKSDAWGFKSDSYFLNQVIVVECNFLATETLVLTQSIEKEMGRTEKTVNAQYQSRIIDIDILFFNDEIIETKNLIIPHAQIQNRRFTLAPLAEIAPNFIHPKLQIKMLQLLENCKDNGKVEKQIPEKWFEN